MRVDKIRSVQHSAEKSVDPDTGEPLEKILIELEPGHWSGRTGERVWAKPLGERRYEIRNTPWYAYDVNWGDVVRCEGMSPANLPIVAEVLRSGGHRTLRVFYLGDDNDEREAILAEINRAGAQYENADGMTYALDIAPNANLGELLRYLSEKEAADVLAWESGWS